MQTTSGGLWTLKALSGEIHSWWFAPNRGWLLDCFLLLTTEALVLGGLGMLLNMAPLGDDPLVHVQKIIDVSRNFSHFQWDPRSFNGYNPSTGFAWASYTLPALLVSLGQNPLVVFHDTFVVYFLAFGPSIYYFARSVGARRILALAVSVPGWSWIGFLGYVGGGAYSRTFTLPFMFTALALTYRCLKQQNTGSLNGRTYGALIIAWTITLLGDVYIAVVPVAIAVPFILLSAGWKSIPSGILRLPVIMLPSLTLTSWFWIPLASHVFNVGSPPSEATPSFSSQVFWAGPLLSMIVFLVRRKDSFPHSRPLRDSIIFSLNLVSMYFLIMGAITPLWPYLPRIWATYDSFNILSFLFPMTVAATLLDVKPFRRSIAPKSLAFFLVVLIVVNAIPTIFLLRPPDRNPVNDAFAQAFSRNLLTSGDYRVSIQGRTSTRWFPFYFPDASQTGGRVLGLDLNPYYQSWYQTEVFFKDDLDKLKSVYVEDKPPIDTTSLVAAPQNFASTTYWLDWYGVQNLVLDPAFYPVNNTVEGFSQHGALFMTKIVSTTYGPLAFVSPVDPTPVLEATNASTIGFYSLQENSENEYHALLALLSYLGLDSRYAVPVYLSSLDRVSPQDFTVIIVDQLTYARATTEIDDLTAKGARIVIAESGLLEQLQRQGPSGTNALIELLSPAIPLYVQNLTASMPTQPQSVFLTPDLWVEGYTENAQDQIQRAQNNLTITLNIPNTTKVARFSLDAALPNPLVLSDQVIARLSLESSAKIQAGLEFTSSNSTSNFVESLNELNEGHLNELQAPFTNFTLWKNPQSKFALATGFTLSILVPPGAPQVTIQLVGASLTAPSHVTYHVPGEVSLSAAGFLQQQTLGALIILSDDAGNLIGSYKMQDPEYSTSIIPLRAFTSTANQSVTRIFSIGATNAEPSSITLAVESGWTPLRGKWTTNQNLAVQTVPSGFRGIVWKETFSSYWDIQGSILGTSSLPLSYFLAGPGMVYVPINGNFLTTLAISYQDSAFVVVVAILGASALIPLAFLRRRIYKIGATCGSPG